MERYRFVAGENYGVSSECQARGQSSIMWSGPVCGAAPGVLGTPLPSARRTVGLCTRGVCSAGAQRSGSDFAPGTAENRPSPGPEAVHMGLECVCELPGTEGGSHYFMPVGTVGEWLSDAVRGAWAQRKWCPDLTVTSLSGVGKEGGHSQAIYCHP